MTLWELKSNQKAFIQDIDSNCSNYERLISYGFNKHQSVQFLYKMALGGPRVYQIGDTVYSLSHSIAKNIMITIQDTDLNLESHSSKYFDNLILKNSIVINSQSPEIN